MTETLVHTDPTEHSTRFYWIVGIILAVITAVEVGVTFLHMPFPILVAILLVLSVLKGAAVVMFFMHLRGDKLPYQLIFLAPFSLAVTFVLFFLLLFSRHVGIAG